MKQIKRNSFTVTYCNEISTSLMWNNPVDYEIFFFTEKHEIKYAFSYAEGIFHSGAISYCVAIFQTPKGVFHWKKHRQSRCFFLVEMRRTPAIGNRSLLDDHSAMLVVPVSHLVVAKSEPFHFLWEITLSSLLLLFHKKPHSANLFSCKRLHNDLLSLPPFCEFFLYRAYGVRFSLNK